MRFSFDLDTADTIRRNPTTQVAIRVDEWPGNVFLLWLPESVSRLCADSVGTLTQDWLWANHHAANEVRQDFATTARGGLRWEYVGHPDVAVEAQLIPQANALLLEVGITNRSVEPLTEVSAQNCFHLSAAPDFACDDFTRLFVRIGGRWRPISSLMPTCDVPMYYRRGFLRDGRPDRWGGRFSSYNQPAEADHPLIVCVSAEGDRAVGTASEDYQCLFHNRQIAYLRCIHSQQAPVRILPVGASVILRQEVYFVGGLQECIAAFEADVTGDLDGDYRFRDVPVPGDKS